MAMHLARSQVAPSERQIEMEPEHAFSAVHHMRNGNRAPLELRIVQPIDGSLRFLSLNQDHW